MTHSVIYRSFALVVCLLAAGCSAADGCIQFVGPCVSLTSTPETATFIVGIDPNLVDQSAPVSKAGFRAVLPVGSTTKLHALRGVNGDITLATDLGTVTWELSDPSAATLTPNSDGSAQLLAVRPGRVGIITANGSNAVYACLTSIPRTCLAIAVIEVVVAP